MNAPGPSNDEYETPEWLFKALDTEFGFTLDGAATKENAKLPHWRGEGMIPGWRGERVFCNPPYSSIVQFVDSAFTAELAVLVLPNRTDTAWFQRLANNPRVELRFFRKRVRFWLNGKETDAPRFGTILAIIRPKD